MLEILWKGCVPIPAVLAQTMLKLEAAGVYVQLSISSIRVSRPGRGLVLGGRLCGYFVVPVQVCCLAGLDK